MSHRLPNYLNMASTIQCPDGAAYSVCLTDLPHHILHNILIYLDEQSLCKAAQTCNLFLRLAGMPCVHLRFACVKHIVEEVNGLLLLLQATQICGKTDLSRQVRLLLSG